MAGQGDATIDISMLNRGGTKYDPIAIAEAIDRKEMQDLHRMANGNGIEKKAAVQAEQDLQPAKQQLQKTNKNDHD